MKFSRTAVPFILVYLIACFASVSYANSFGKIAFTRSIRLNREILIADSDGENVEILTEGQHPSWSPDGSMIVFTRGGGLNDDIYTMKADGKARKPLGLSGSYPLFSPDGKKIAYFEVFIIPNVNIWLSVADIDGGNQKRLKDLNNMNGRAHSWAPDSKRVAYCDRGKLYIINVETLDYKQIVCQKPDGEIEGLVSVDWAPRGDRLALASERFIPGPLVNIPPSRDHGIWVVDTDGLNAERLTEDNERAPEWSPDGTEIAFVDVRRKISIMDADGENVRRLTDSIDMNEYELDPSWFGIWAAVQPQNSLMTMWGKIKSASE